MYKDEIKDLYSKKRESKKMILCDLLSLYFRLRIGYPNLNMERDNIKFLIIFYLNYEDMEFDILKEIDNKFGYVDYNSDIEDILDELDLVYNYYYDYIESVITNYESVIVNNIINIIIDRISGNYINSNNYKYRLSLPVFNKVLEKEKILEKIRSI